MPKRKSREANHTTVKATNHTTAKTTNAKMTDSTRIALIVGIVCVVLVAIVLGTFIWRGTHMTRYGGMQGMRAAGAGQPLGAGDAAPGTQNVEVGTDGVQVVRIAVTSNGYEPSQPTVVAGKPVRLIFDGSRATGCYQYLVSNELGFSKKLTAGETAIDIAPLAAGTYKFSCSMNMIRGSLHVIEQTDNAAGNVQTGTVAAPIQNVQPTNTIPNTQSANQAAGATCGAGCGCGMK